MGKCLLEIVLNNPFIEIKTDKIIDVVESVFEETGKRINFKQAVLYYKNNRGQDRKRKLKNTFMLWLIN